MTWRDNEPNAIHVFFWDSFRVQESSHLTNIWAQKSGWNRRKICGTPIHMIWASLWQKSCLTSPYLNTGWWIWSTIQQGKLSPAWQKLWTAQKTTSITLFGSFACADDEWNSKMFKHSRINGNFISSLLCLLSLSWLNRRRCLIVSVNRDDGAMAHRDGKPWVRVASSAPIAQVEWKTLSRHGAQSAQREPHFLRPPTWPCYRPALLSHVCKSLSVHFNRDIFNFPALSLNWLPSQRGVNASAPGRDHKYFKLLQ